MKRSSKDFIVIGFALFAMFFGAGNLIFPPFLGKTMGSNFPIAILGFIITGVGLPLMGIIACAKSGGNFENMAGRVGKYFSIIATTMLILALGPMLAIPRTAATTFELSVKPLFPSVNPLVSMFVYFAINLVFVLKPSSIIDTIGKYLTPILLIMLSTVVIKGIVSPMGPLVHVDASNVFSSSLLEGYQTMDAMSSVIFASIVVASVVAKGYKKKEEILSVTIKAGLVAIAGLGFIYGGLMYLGSQTTTLLPADIMKTELVLEIATRTLGYFGSVAIGISVGVACLTTSIGLTATGAEFFAKITKNKLSYKLNAFIISGVSIAIGTLGVDEIVKYAFPILKILYPIVIVLILITLMGNLVKDNRVVKFSVYTTLIVSVIDTINSLGVGTGILQPILDFIPLSSIGFSWVIPTAVALILASMFVGMRNSNKTNKESNTDLNNVA